MEGDRGAYDLQTHVAPDVIERRTDDIDLARDFLSHGLKGFVLKSHYLPTAERAKVVTRAVPGIAAYGAVTLNHAVGGLNPVTVEISGRSGCRIVWMPTVDAENETAGLPGSGTKKLPFWASIQRELAAKGISPPPMSVIEEDGAVTERARQCLDLIAEHDMIMATGHLGQREIVALVAAARDAGVKRVVVTHAEFPSQNLTPEEQVEVADMGAVIEHCFTTMHTGKATWETCFENVRAVGPERCPVVERPRANDQPARGGRARELRAGVSRRGFYSGRSAGDGGDERGAFGGALVNALLSLVFAASLDGALADPAVAAALEYVSDHRDETAAMLVEVGANPLALRRGARACRAGRGAHARHRAR